MKKQMLSVCAATVLAASVLVGGAVQAFAAPAQPADAAVPAVVTEENCLSGSWKRASDPTVTAKVRKVFDKAFDRLVGASYTPAAVLATRTTAKGTQYRVLCKRTVCYPGAQEQYVVVTLQRGLLGRAEIVDIGDALCATDLVDNQEMTGGWQEAASPALTDEAKAAFEKATDGLVVVDYVPVALLSTQVVAGTNYRILCEATVVYPGAEMHYAVMTVYEGLDGSANILSVTDSLAS